MADDKRSFVDPHMHQWDSLANPWYPFPVPGNDWGLGLTREFPPRFLVDDYLRATSAVNVTKAVHVSAVISPADAAAESIWLEQHAEHNPLVRGVIGTVDLEQSETAVEAAIEREMASPRYRGLRLLNGLDYETPLADRLMRRLAANNLVYDAVTHFDKGTAAAARGLGKHESLTVVLEHCGWPAHHDADAFRAWEHEAAEFAALPNSYCKLSGVGMWIHRIDPEIFASYFTACIDLFGPERCMFASNFPVDLSYGDPADLFAVFEEVAGRYAPDEQEWLYGATAEQVYRI